QSDSVSEALDRVVLRATRRSREDRYTDAGQMLDELDEAARIGRFPAYAVPAPRQSSWSRARAAAAVSGAGSESEFEADERESGEYLQRGGWPVPNRSPT